MGKTNPNPSLAKVMGHNILQKVKTFINLELPLLRETSKSWPNLLATLVSLVNANINQVNTGINPSEKDIIAQAVLTNNEMWTGWYWPKSLFQLDLNLTSHTKGYFLSF